MIRRPIRMNLMRVVIRQLQVAKLVADPDFDESSTPKSYGTPAGGTLVLDGQITLGQYKEQSPSMSGDRRRIAGHLCFGAAYLEKLGVVLRSGDIIVSVAGKPFDAVITTVRPKAQLGGEFLLIIANFVENVHKKGAGA